MSKEPIFIPVNRRKLLIQTIFFSSMALVTLITGFGVAEQAESMEPWIWQGIGIVLCLFLLLAAAAKMKRRGDGSAGLIVDKEGIHDNVSDISIGTIRWTDVKMVDPTKCKKEGFLIIEVKNAGQYKKKAKNSAISRLLEQNIRRYDTPVVIDTSYLKESLESVVDKVANYKR